MTFIDYLKQQNLGHAGLKWKRLSYVIALALGSLILSHDPLAAVVFPLVLLGLYYFNFRNSQRK